MPQRGEPRRDARIAIAGQRFDLTAPWQRILSARKDRDRVPANQRSVDDVAPEKTRSAENQQPHAAAIRRNSCACSATSPQASTLPPPSAEPPCQSVMRPPAVSTIGISA